MGDGVKIYHKYKSITCYAQLYCDNGCITTSDIIKQLLNFVTLLEDVSSSVDYSGSISPCWYLVSYFLQGFEYQLD